MVRRGLFVFLETKETINALSGIRQIETRLTSGNVSSTDSCTFSSRTEIAGLGMQSGRQSEVTARRRGL